MTTDQFLFSDDEMTQLRREYLVDVEDKLSLLRTNAAALSNRARFKSAFPVLLFIAHQLKGSGGSLGFPQVTEIARAAGGELNLFLDDEQAPRPTPKILSQRLLELCDQLESVVREARLAIG